MKFRKKNIYKSLIHKLYILIFIFTLLISAIVWSCVNYQGKNQIFAALPLEKLRGADDSLEFTKNSFIDSLLTNLNYESLYSTLLSNESNYQLTGSVKSSQYIYNALFDISIKNNLILIHANININLNSNSSEVAFNNIKIDFFLSQDSIYFKVISLPDLLYSYLNTFLYTSDLKSKYEGQWIKFSFKALQAQYGVDFSRFISNFIPFLSSSAKTSIFLKDLKNYSIFENSTFMDRTFIGSDQYINIKSHLSSEKLLRFVLLESQKDLMLPKNFLKSISNLNSDLKFSSIEFLINPINYSIINQSYDFIINDMDIKANLKQTINTTVKIAIPDKSIDILEIINTLSSQQ